MKKKQKRTKKRRKIKKKKSEESDKFNLKKYYLPYSVNTTRKYIYINIYNEF